MKSEGPALNHLLLRLRNISSEVFSSEADAMAICCDFLRDVHQDQSLHSVINWDGWSKNKNKSQIILLAIWLYLDEGLRQLNFSKVLQFFEEGLKEYSLLVNVEQIMEEAERSEEFVRRCLRVLELRPKGESQAQAEDRFQTLDSIEAERLEEMAVAAGSGHRGF